MEGSGCIEIHVGTVYQLGVAAAAFAAACHPWPDSEIILRESIRVLRRQDRRVRGLDRRSDLGEADAMCSLHSLGRRGSADRSAYFCATRDETGNMPELPAIFPDQMAPVAIGGAAGRTLTLMRWGITAARVKAMDIDTQVGLGGALWSAGQDDVLAPVEAGEPVTLPFGTLAFLVLPGRAFVLLPGRNVRRCKLAVPAHIVPGADGGHRLDTQARDWTDEATIRAEASAAVAVAVAVAERMERSASSGCARPWRSTPATRPKPPGSTRRSTASAGRSSGSVSEPSAAAEEPYANQRRGGRIRAEPRQLTR